ncbi:MAG: hypothetical protein ACKON7_02865, partial [Planctomycetaceae bacterium]
MPKRCQPTACEAPATCGITGHALVSARLSEIAALRDRSGPPGAPALPPRFAAAPAVPPAQDPSVGWASIANARPRHTGSPAAAAVSSSSGSSTHSVATSHTQGGSPAVAAAWTIVAAAKSPSASASSPPPTPRCGPRMPRPTLTAPATECSEHCGTMWGDTLTPPPAARPASVLAAASRPSRREAATTAWRERPPGSGDRAASAASTACTPTTVCSSACRRNRVG